jgi:hypothetical protein
VRNARQQPTQSGNPAAGNDRNSIVTTINRRVSVRRRTSKEDQLLPALRPYARMGFDPTGWSGQEAYGACIFCGKEGKLYVNSETGQYRCMAGGCGREGNIHTAMDEWYRLWLEDGQSNGPWASLSEARGLPVEVLKGAGLVWIGSEWLLPIRGKTGAIANLRFYNPLEERPKFKGLPERGAHLWGGEKVEDGDKRTLFICEGEWDGMALEYMLSRDGQEGVVLGVPGSNIWKNDWSEWLMRRKIVMCYDHDADGLKGTRRVVGSLLAMGCNLKWVDWPIEMPDKYDIRDFVADGATYKLLMEMVKPWKDPDTAVSKSGAGGINGRGKSKRQGASSGEGQGKDGGEDAPERRRLDDPSRPTMDQVVERYREWLHMGDDMVDMLRLAYAVVLSQFVGDDPLWVHLAGPPGSGKTAILMSLMGLSRVHFASTITAHSLVSGFQVSGGGDPSLIPQLHGKTFVLKDWTEVTEMPPAVKAEVYSIFRGAFDGTVEKPFGNGVVRKYTSKFNMVTGVTQSIFAEMGASLGERFLIYHVIKGVGWSAREAVMAAITNSGRGDEKRQALEDTATAFLEVDVEPEEIPDIPQEMAVRIAALSELTSMLRANVAKDYRSGNVTYRPQHEVGTRLGIQLAKLMKGLALCRTPVEMHPDDLRLVARVAMDSCIGFNLDVVRSLWERDGQTTAELAEACAIPSTTLAERLRDMVMLGIIRKERTDIVAGRGQPPILHHLTPVVRELWEEAGLTDPSFSQEVATLAYAKQSQNLEPGTRKVRVRRKPRRGEVHEVGEGEGSGG